LLPAVDQNGVFLVSLPSAAVQMASDGAWNWEIVMSVPLLGKKNFNNIL
jgi:hypothetical protein